MKKCIIFCSGLLLALTALAQIRLELKAMPVQVALQLYGRVVAKELVFGPGITTLTNRITVKPASPSSNAEVVKILETAMREQANLEFAPLDDKRIAVTVTNK